MIEVVPARLHACIKVCYTTFLVPGNVVGPHAPRTDA